MGMIDTHFLAIVGAGGVAGCAWLPLLTPLFNHDSPRLWGFPAFYWLQFAFILVGVVTTSVVYQMTKKRR